MAARDLNLITPASIFTPVSQEQDRERAQINSLWKPMMPLPLKDEREPMFSC